jgi:cardiolipin synthase (CMP-forming)
MQNAVYTLPNLLTASRLVLAPVVVWRLAVQDVEGAFWVFFAAAITDLLDGNIARLFNQRSVLGAWLDPIADKVMLLSSLFALVWVDILPLWLAVIVALRDLVVLSGAAAYRTLTGGLEVTPTWLGKTATFFEFALVSLALASAALGWGVAAWVDSLLHLTGLLVAASGVQYVWLWSKKTRRHRRAEGEEKVSRI